MIATFQRRARVRALRSRAAGLRRRTRVFRLYGASSSGDVPRHVGRCGDDGFQRRALHLADLVELLFDGFRLQRDGLTRLGDRTDACLTNGGKALERRPPATKAKRRQTGKSQAPTRIQVRTDQDPGRTEGDPGRTDEDPDRTDQNPDRTDQDHLKTISASPTRVRR
jgi:hypothetical protein